MSKKNVEQNDDKFFEVPEEDLGTVAYPEDELVSMEEPLRSSPEWQEYIMKHFVEGEVFEINGRKCPTANALERVTRLLIGNVVSQGVVELKHIEKPMNKVVATYQVTIDLYDWPGKIYTVSDVASVWECNTDDLFLGYQEETACTRAKGRCFKTALGFNGVSFEELTREKNVAESVQKFKSIDDKPTDGSFNEKEDITDRQSTFILKSTRELGINLDKYIKYVQMEHGDHLLKNVKVVVKDEREKLVGMSKQEASDYFIKPFNVYKQGDKPIPQVILNKD